MGENTYMAIFLQKLPYRKNAIHFCTMAIFPYGNFPRDRDQLADERANAPTLQSWKKVGT